jgi:hypothetical protein
MCEAHGGQFMSSIHLNSTRCVSQSPLFSILQKHFLLAAALSGKAWAQDHNDNNVPHILFFSMVVHFKGRLAYYDLSGAKSEY